MEAEINCSELCDSFPSQELDRRPIHDLCKTTIVSKQPWDVKAVQIYMLLVEVAKGRGEEMLIQDMYFQALVMMREFVCDL